MDGIQYADDVIDSVLELLKETFGDYFKAYYSGDPEMIPEANYPCVIVSETVGSITSGATMTDNIIEQADIRIVMNKKDDFGADQDIDLTEKRLRRIVKGQYPLGHDRQLEYHDQSIMGVLRSNFTLRNNSINNSVSTESGVNARPASDTTDIITQEYNLTIEIERYAYVIERS